MVDTNLKSMASDQKPSSTSGSGMDSQEGPALSTGVGSKGAGVPLQNEKNSPSFGQTNPSFSGSADSMLSSNPGNQFQSGQSAESAGQSGMSSPSSTNQPSPFASTATSQTQPSPSSFSQTQTDPYSSAPTQPPLASEQLQSPIDPPPPPTPALDPSSTVDQPPSVLTTSKKRGFPWALIFGIVAVLILGGVGFLAYQNMQLKKEVAPVAQPTPQVPLSTPPLQANPTPTTAVETTSYTSDVLPIRISLPSDWTATESENKALANQRKITAESPDFTLTGDTVSAGYQLIIGPVSDLSNKYQTFDAFAAEENADSEYQVKVVNGISWLVGENIGKTLMGQTPLTITLFAMEEDTKAAAIFDQIITSFVFTEAL